MNATAETLPRIARRADASYLDFVEGFREYILGPGANFENRLNAALEAEEQRRGQRFTELEALSRYMHSLPLGRLRDALGCQEHRCCRTR